ncbi:MAG: hypothetical protein ACOC0J_02145, partial [Myxococcota bacterium]
ARRSTGKRTAGKKKAARAAAAAEGERPAKKTGRVGRPPVNVGPCSVPGCERPAKTRGLCSAHYQQHRRLTREGKPGLITNGAARAPGSRKTTTRKKARTRTAGRSTPSAQQAQSAPKVVAESTTKE